MLSTMLLVLAVYDNFFTIAETTEIPVQCRPPIKSSSNDTKLPDVVVFLEHKERSVTNFKPWGPYTYREGMYRFNSSGEIQTKTLKVSKGKEVTIALSLNETHVCAASDYILIEDTTSLYSGDYNKTEVCNSVCFPANEYQKRHNFQVFKSFTDGGYPLGQWEEFDSISVYSALNKEVECYYRNETFDFHPDYDQPNFDDVKTWVKRCPVGQVCRITRGQRTWSTSAYLWVGCELDDGQFGGCADTCDSYEFQGDYRWDTTCRYCCNSDLCNSPSKCTKRECDLSNTEPNNNRRSESGAYIHMPLQPLVMILLMALFIMKG